MIATRKPHVAVAFSCLLLAALPCTREILRAADTPAPVNAADIQFFESRIRPILAKHCYECHSATSKIVRGNFLADSRDSLRKGGDSGPAIQPGKPAESLLLAALKHESLEMPPKEKLPNTVIADFATWIERGAVDPRTEPTHSHLKAVDWTAAAQHWSFQPVPDVSPPEATGSSHRWASNPIDQFIAHQLQATGFAPSPSAEKRTLIRRATYDLTGLPPTTSEVQAFVADDAPDAYARLLDRLLASPHYGERWGRHWLDLVRYADSNGADENHNLPNAWRYRDWVVQKLNSDLPLDQFIVQQLAGDLLPAPEIEQEAGDLLTATGMLVIGPKMLAEQDKDKMIIDIVDEQVDTVSRTLLGLTIGCARCHDHKFDPISTRDYYALAGIFYSTQSMADRAFVSKWMERPRPSRAIEAQRVAYQPQIDEAQAKLDQLKKARADATEPVTDEALKAQKDLVEKLIKEMPAFDMAMAVKEGTPKDLPVHIRGNHLALSPEAVTRTMPKILTQVHSAPAIEPASSGRLEFANWLIASENPLTARVFVNRLWMWHFGKALLRSPSNFGLQAEAPTHPQLLDWLARELIGRQWSLKQMHRLVMHSATYQMSSQSISADEQRDPENRLCRRQNRRRLEAEPIRDAVFFVGGELDLKVGNIAANTDAKRRAIYLPINRAALYEMFSTFDYVETANHIEQRPATTVPQQALFLMNSSIVVGQAKNIARDLLRKEESGAAQNNRAMIGAAFERLYSRLPSEPEMDRTEQFLNAAETQLSAVSDPQDRRFQAWTALCRALIAANEFVYIE